MVNFSNIIRGPLQQCFIGYRISHTFQNQEYATEAINLGLSYVFNELNIRKVSANYMPKNITSARVLEKLGFEKEGLAKKYLRINREWEDHILTSKINEDWVVYNSQNVTIGKGNISGKEVYANKDFKKDEVVIKYKLKPLTEKEYRPSAGILVKKGHAPILTLVNSKL